MLVQVKHSKLGFLTGFYYKGEGEGSTYRGRAGNYAKIRMKVIKSTRTQILHKQKK